MNNIKLLGRDKAEEILKGALSLSTADQTQVTLATGAQDLTRFASSVIHQNVSELSADLSVKAVIGKKIGFASTSTLSEESIKATVEKAVEFAKHQQENPDFVSLPHPAERNGHGRGDLKTFYESTAEIGPEDRARAVGNVMDAATANDAEAAGSYSTVSGEFAVANSFGIFDYRQSTSANLSTVVTAGTGFGYANKMSMDAAQIDAAAIGKEAADRAAASREPISIDAGEYDVILLPYAVAEMVEFMAWLGLGALSIQEERSFMNGKFGEKICGENITIWDNGYDPRGFIRTFDPEGVPKQKVEMIQRGVAKAVVYDTYTAFKEGKQSTGHATGGVGTYGPMPANLFVGAGDNTVEEMIASTKRGLFVTRFHYINVLQPVLTILTGMTRDGTFLIEDGKITKPVKNLRFTESVLNALSNVEMLGKDLVCQGSVTVPAMKVKDFRFTGTTEF